MKGGDMEGLNFMNMPGTAQHFVEFIIGITMSSAEAFNVDDYSEWAKLKAETYKTDFEMYKANFYDYEKGCWVEEKDVEAFNKDSMKVINDLIKTINNFPEG